MIGLSTSMAEERVVVQASEVETKIRAGEPAEFDGYLIVGELNLSTLKIDEEVHFNNTIFQNSVNCGSATFNKAAYIRSSSFNGDADFGPSRFNGDADFGSSRFNRYADFRSSRFNRYADFRSSRFNRYADFRSSSFNGTAYFRSSSFNGTAYFRSSSFNGTADFRSSSFNTTDFTAAQFDKEARFDDSQFVGIASFNNSLFKGDALFDNTTFWNKLSLTRTRYDKLFIRWHNIKGGLIYDDAAYMSLMKTFKDLGYFEDYDSCYFQYRKEHRAQPWPAINDWEEVIRKAIDYPLEWFYGYGTKPLNAFLISIFIIIAFGIFWWSIGLGSAEDATKENLNPGEEWIDRDITDVLGFSVTVFLSGTKFFIDPPIIPRIKGRSRSLIKKAFVLERLLGALFSILFFIAVGATIVRAA